MIWLGLIAFALVGAIAWWGRIMDCYGNVVDRYRNDDDE